MVSLVWLTVVALLGLYIFNYYRCFARNLAAAKQSGVPYVVLPVYTFNRFWLVTHRLWFPILEKLPVSWTSPWLQFLDPEWVWLRKREPFDLLGSDVFILCSPGSNAFFVADPEAVTQIVTRRNDFPKPIEIYGSVDLFGKNVVSTEGSIWRHHRKITSPPFTEKNNHMVWLESLHQAKSMMTSWMGKENEQGKGQKTVVADVAAATMRLSLHVISRAGFGVQLLWPHEEVEEKGRSGALPEGHTMTYKDALSTLLENILAVMLVPKWFLARAPFEWARVAYESYIEWGKYMKEMHQEKKDEVKAGEKREGMDLMGALVNGAGEKQLLTDSEVLGNAFVFILAGHETAANTLHFSMLYLAMNWSSQSRLHKDLDDIFGDRPVEQWDYERDVPKLFGSMAGAVMNEELRLIPPVIGIPKRTLKNSPQPLTLSGRRIIVPADCHITLDTVATHRNPKHWPTLCGPNASVSEIERDLDTFKPERWLLDPSSSSSSNNKKPSATSTTTTSDSETEHDIGGPESSDTSSQLFHPVRGSYIPFSEGYRACLGRRFAQVEVLAVIAAVFKNYSVELALDEYADDAGIAAMTVDSRRETWGQAKAKAEDLLRWGMGTIITIQMRNGKVPLRFVKRGEERFRYD